MGGKNTGALSQNRNVLNRLVTARNRLREARTRVVDALGAGPVESHIAESIRLVDADIDVVTKRISVLGGGRV